MGALTTLRWAARDLRRRWPMVVAIALVVAVGTGAYSALGSTATWRHESNDASFELLHMYDLRVKATEGAHAARGEMLATLDRLPDPGIVEVAEERLVASTQVDASTADEAILVPGRIIGMDLAGGGPHVNAVDVRAGEGRALTPTTPVARSSSWSAASRPSTASTPGATCAWPGTARCARSASPSSPSTSS